MPLHSEACSVCSATSLVYIFGAPLSSAQPCFEVIFLENRYFSGKVCSTLELEYFFSRSWGKFAHYIAQQRLYFCKGYEQWATCRLLRNDQQHLLPGFGRFLLLTWAVGRCVISRQPNSVANCRLHFLSTFGALDTWIVIVQI